MHHFHTEPFKHQLEAFERSRSEEIFALFHEQGTGKSKVILDSSVWLYSRSEISAAVIVAPKGVDENWIQNEIPTHVSPEVPTRSVLLRASKVGTKRFQREFRDALAFKGLLFVALNIDALRTGAVHSMLKELLTRRVSLLAVDESTTIKNISAARTKKLIGLAPLARYRRILSGTPFPEGPLDLFAQTQFLRKGLLGSKSWHHFRMRYADWELKLTAGGSGYESLISYKRLDELAEKTAPFSSRVSKEDCLDLPPKIYQTFRVRMTAIQAEVYRSMAKDGIACVSGDGDEILSAGSAVVAAMRLHQISGGFVPKQENEPAVPIPGGNPKLEATVDLARASVGGVLIWCAFKAECRALLEALGEEAVGYYGDTPDSIRAENVRRFQSGAAKYLVGTTQTGGRGLTLTAAKHVIYYSNSFSLEGRIQSEDRAHRIGQRDSVMYTDVIAEDSLDLSVYTALMEKNSLAGHMMQRIVSEHLRTVV